MKPHLLTALYTSLTMVAFASNSILNRLALGQESIDAVSYTTIRLMAGAIALWLISSVRGPAQYRAFVATGSLL